MQYLVSVQGTLATTVGRSEKTPKIGAALPEYNPAARKHIAQDCQRPNLQVQAQHP
jgi:hypothetical protein